MFGGVVNMHKALIYIKKHIKKTEKMTLSWEVSSLNLWVFTPPIGGGGCKNITARNSGLVIIFCNITSNER